MNDGVEAPKRLDLLWPTLVAMRDLGGSASNRELLDRLTSNLQLPDKAFDVSHGEGGLKDEFYREAGWARTFLKVAGAIDNSSRGVWVITNEGRSIRSEQEARRKVADARSKYLKELRRKGGNDRKKYPEEKSGKRSMADHAHKDGGHISSEEGENLQDEHSWREGLLEVVRSMKPPAFERLCRRILREAGFTKVEVTGRPGDEGIDGAGVLRVNLLSFRVLFQCKRFAGSVGPGAVRDFRGAIAGRADKGLFITTGTFTSKAGEEAAREGAQTIDLIDGDDLCDLLKKYGLGVKVTERVEFDDAFFDGI